MELERALARLSEIHAHVARGEVFRGYRAVPIALTSLTAVVAAGAQELVVPPADPHAFALFWIAAAGVCAAICATDFWLQGRFAARAALRQRTWPVVSQYLPAVAVGAALAFALADSEHARLLPALWALVHGLGLFASRPFLPRTVGWVSAWFLAAGTWLLLGSADGPPIPDPWTMGITFGVGHALLALALHADLERVQATGTQRRSVR